MQVELGDADAASTASPRRWRSSRAWPVLLNAAAAVPSIEGRRPENTVTKGLQIVNFMESTLW